MSIALRKLLGLPAADAPLLFLAPMAGYTRAPMRRICHQKGAAVTYTEMTNDRGLLQDADKTWHLLETLPDEGPVIAHLYGTEPELLAAAAAKASETKRFIAIDLNAGCPVHKVTAGGAGAALIRDPQRIHDILRAMRRATSLPITLKTRPGPQPDKIAIFEILSAAETAGAHALTLHGRFTSQGHGGDVHVNILAEVKARAKIPIIGNGGVCSPYHAFRMLRETQVDALMIARAAIGNPWIFEDIHAALATGEEPPVHNPTHGRTRRDLGILRQVFESHLMAEYDFIKLLHDKYDLPRNSADIEENLVTTFRCHLFRYLHGLKGSSYIRGRLSTLKTLHDIHVAVNACFEREAAYRANAHTPECGVPKRPLFNVVTRGQAILSE